MKKILGALAIGVLLVLAPCCARQAGGMATISVIARFKDGTKPRQARCFIQTSSQIPDQSHPYTHPEITGQDGDWIIRNVAADTWGIDVSGDDFALTDQCRQRIEVKGSEEITVKFLLQRGGTVSGRVVYADTGKPAKGALVCGGAWDSRRDITDALGRYSVDHLPPGRTEVVAGMDGFITTTSETAELKDGGGVNVPDIRLRRGGWISGRVVCPVDFDKKPGSHKLFLRGSVMARGEGKLRPRARFTSVALHKETGFQYRLGPLPPGSYTVEAYLNVFEGSKSPKNRWRGQTGRINVMVGKETSGVVITVK